MWKCAAVQPLCAVRVLGCLVVWTEPGHMLRLVEAERRVTAVWVTMCTQLVGHWHKELVLSNCKPGGPAVNLHDDATIV